MDDIFLDSIFGKPSHDPGGKVRINVSSDIVSTADFSKCEKYRYSLSRTWNSKLPSVLFIMMNPSTADIHVNDPTVAKCIRYAKSWGYGKLMVGNVCGYRATDKKMLLEVSDPVGPENHSSIVKMALEANLTVIAHGQLPKNLQKHAKIACDLLRNTRIELHYLKLSVDGTPCHPLYLKENLKPEKWITF